MGQTLARVGEPRFRSIAKDWRSFAVAVIQATICRRPAVNLNHLFNNITLNSGDFLEMLGTGTNRGILQWESGNGPAAETDFSEAIRLLEAVGSERPRTVQELDRALNNLAGAMEARADAGAEAFYVRAIDGHESLVARVPENREYQLELAKFSNNLAVFLEQQGRRADAEMRNRRATALLTNLARPAPSLGIELADTHNLRGAIVQAERRAEAERSFEESLDLFTDLSSVPALLRMPAFHQRFGDLLVNLSLLAQSGASNADARVTNRAIDAYLGVATRIADSGDAAQARAALETINRVLPEVPQRDRQRVAAMQVRLGRVAASGPR